MDEQARHRNICFTILSLSLYHTLTHSQALDIGSTVNSRAGFSPIRAGFGPMAGALSFKATARKTRCKQVQHDEKIGRISDEDLVTPNSHDEAVINYSITPLANLVADHQLRESVQRAILTYITTQLRKIS